MYRSPTAVAFYPSLAQTCALGRCPMRKTPCARVVLTVLRWLNRDRRPLQGIWSIEDWRFSRSCRRPSKLYESSPGQIQGAIDSLVRRAIKSLDIRRDQEPFDLLRALIGVSHVASGPDCCKGRRLVDILIIGSQLVTLKSAWLQWTGCRVTRIRTGVTIRKYC